VKHSRAFIVALNSDDDFEWLVEFREIVKELAARDRLTGYSIDWLNEHCKPFTYRARYDLDGFTPQVELEFAEEDRGLSAAAGTVTSFLSFLQEMQEKRNYGPNAIYPKIAICPVCPDFYIRECVGRTKHYCSSKCYYRKWRKKEKAAKKAK